MRPAALSLYRPLPGAKARLVAFPHAGGGASAFRGLATALAARNVELCALQPPGRENRMAAPFHHSAEATALELASALGTLPLLPTAFLGHSLGGLVAYLVARLGEERGSGPSHLVASASLSPLLRGDRAGASERSAAKETLRDRILALGGVPEAIGRDPDLFAIFEPVIRADLDLAERYVHRASEPLACPILVYSGSRDAGAPDEAASAWQDLSKAPIRRRTFEGGHFFLYAEVGAVATALVEDLGW